MRETYAIRINRTLYPPEYLPGFNTKEEATGFLNTMELEDGANYSVVYVKEYFNRAMDKEGKFTISTIAELKEPGLNK